MRKLLTIGLVVAAGFFVTTNCTLAGFLLLSALFVGGFNGCR